MLVQGRRLENAAKHQATLFILGTPSSMTDYTIFSCIPWAIFFLKLGAQLLLNRPVAEGFAKQLLDLDSHPCIQNNSGLHLMRVQGKMHIHFKELALGASISEQARKLTHSKNSQHLKGIPS